MPLIIVTGFPLTGKTYRSEQLKAHFSSQCKVVVINEESLSLPAKHTIYSSVQEEKKARSEILSATERYLDTKTLVIVDSLNYIKGLRYQLYCIARAIGTTHCVLYCSGQEAQCIERLSTCPQRYTEVQIKELCSRYEEPDPFAKWDKPLFRLNPQDQQPPMLQEIEKCLFHGFIPPPNLSTVQKATSNSGQLPILDEHTKQVLSQLTAWMQRGNSIGMCPIQTSPAKHENLLVKRKLTQAELLRLQKHFISLNKLHSLPEASIASTFVAFLSKNT